MLPYDDDCSAIVYATFELITMKIIVLYLCIDDISDDNVNIHVCMDLFDVWIQITVRLIRHGSVLLIWTMFEYTLINSNITDDFESLLFKL